MGWQVAAAEVGKAAGWKGAAAAGAAQGIGTGLFGWIGAKRARKFARNESTRAYQRDVSMWNKMNAYNTPLAQRQRLEAANLNPALMYKGAPQNTTNTMPKYNPPGQPTYTHKIEMASLHQDLRLKAAQASKLEAEAAWLGQEKSEKVIGLKLDNFFKMVQSGKQFSWNKSMGAGIIGEVKVEGSPVSPYQVQYDAEVKAKVNNAIISDAAVRLSRFNLQMQDDPTLRMSLADLPLDELLQRIAILAGGKIIGASGNIVPRTGIGKISTGKKKTSFIKKGTTGLKNSGKSWNVYTPRKGRTKNWIDPRSKFTKYNPKDR